MTIKCSIELRRLSRWDELGKHWVRISRSQRSRLTNWCFTRMIDQQIAGSMHRLIDSDWSVDASSMALTSCDTHFVQLARDEKSKNRKIRTLYSIAIRGALGIARRSHIDGLLDWLVDRLIKREYCIPVMNIAIGWLIDWDNYCVLIDQNWHDSGDQPTN